MPSFLHEALLMLFRNRPALAPELLRDALHVELPDYTEVRVDSADLTDIEPAEYRADLVILLSHGSPVLVSRKSPTAMVNCLPQSRRGFKVPTRQIWMQSPSGC